MLSGGSGANPEPTVKSGWEKEKNSGLAKGEIYPFLSPIFLLPFPRDPEVLHLFRVFFIHL
jgi:hypothetical protein